MKRSRSVVENEDLDRDKLREKEISAALEKHALEKRKHNDRAVRKRFYAHLFAQVVDTLVDLATCGGQFKLSQCEISMRFHIDGSEVQKRDVVFHTAKELLDRLVYSVPMDIHMGGIFLGALEDPKRTEERYLCTKAGAAAYGPFCVDVDMNDYAPPRCKYTVRDGICMCAPDRVCNTCWRVVLEPGRAVLHMLLKKVFGFKAIFYVFSGRRGYHAWVLDQRVVRWTSYQRTTVINRLQNMKDDLEMSNVVFDMLEPFFDYYLAKNKRQPFKELWEGMVYVADQRKMRQLKKEAVLETLYPKFDLNVSRDPTHLIKFPLVLHQTTGFFTLTIPPPGRKSRAFNPEKDALTARDLSEKDMHVSVQPIKEALRIAYHQNLGMRVKTKQ